MGGNAYDWPRVDHRKNRSEDVTDLLSEIRGWKKVLKTESSMPGTAGGKGRPGESGKDGDMGLRDLPGTRGHTQTVVVKSEVGAPGPHGLLGPCGPTGDRGDSGAVGPAGQPGLLGSVGPSRERGPPGLPGEAVGIHRSRLTGNYWIDPNQGSTSDSFEAECDMKTMHTCVYAAPNQIHGTS